MSLEIIGRLINNNDNNRELQPSSRQDNQGKVMITLVMWHKYELQSPSQKHIKVKVY